ncbi:MAG: cytochrome C biogenesis protein, partial [Ignavibacteriae bacterium]|nr:cytochrome C biogenesis protein [Ignavibacteriota bacterium]
LFLLGVVATGGFSEKDSIDLEKGKTASIFGYDLTFEGYNKIPNTEKFEFNIKVEKGNSSSTIAPIMFVSSMNNSLMREPAIWNRFTKDFYVTPLSYENGETQTKSAGKKVTLKKGESIDYQGDNIVFESFDFPADAMSAMMGGGNFTIGANLIVKAYGGKSYKVEPKMKSVDGKREFVPVEVKDLDLVVEMTNLDASGTVNLILRSLSGDKQEIVSAPKEVLSIEASIKPFINLVWSGVILMVIGFIISAVKRTKET